MGSEPVIGAAGAEQPEKGRKRERRAEGSSRQGGGEMQWLSRLGAPSAEGDAQSCSAKHEERMLNSNVQSILVAESLPEQSISAP